MKKPDRFAQMVGQHRHIACDGMGYVLLEETARHLLRLEYNRVVRVVQTIRSTGWDQDYIKRSDLLDALAKRKEGK